MNTLFDTLVGIVESDYSKETLCNLNDIIEYADNPVIDLDAARKIQTAGLKWLDAMENGSEWSLYRYEAMCALSRSIAQSIYDDKLNGMDADEAYHFLTVNMAKLNATFTEDDNHQMFDFADTSCLLFPVNENTYTWFVRSLFGPGCMD